MLMLKFYVAKWIDDDERSLDDDDAIIQIKKKLHFEIIKVFEIHKFINKCESVF